MASSEFPRHRSDPLITPHKPAKRPAPSQGAGAPEGPRASGTPEPPMPGASAAPHASPSSPSPYKAAQQSARVERPAARMPRRNARPPRSGNRLFRRGGRLRWRPRGRWRFGWRLRLAAVMLITLIGVLAFRDSDAGRGAALPSVRKGGPLELPAPQRFPEQDTVRTREGRWVTRYAADEILQARTERYINQYRPEGAVVVVCDLRTGQIRTLVERDSNETSSRPRLALGTTFPAASLAKIVTAATVLERGIYRPHDDLPLVGGAHTLYRAQLRVPANGRYHTVTLREAFARSINPTFGLLGLRVGPEPLRDMARRLGFSSDPRPVATAGAGGAVEAASLASATDPEALATRSLPADDGVQARLTPPDTGGFALAEVASGYTTATTLSPLHALRIARAIGEDGRLLPVSFTRHLQSLDNGRTLTLPHAETRPFASASTLQSLRTLMEATVTSGTARRGFRRNMSEADFQRLEMGGKTGSLNGHNPPGRYEWFIGYARRKDHPDQGIAVAVMLINRTYLAVHAAEMAGLVIRDWSRYSAPYPDEDGKYLAGR